MADSGLICPRWSSVCREMDVALLHHHPPTRPPRESRRLSGVPRSTGRPVPYWMDGGAAVAGTAPPGTPDPTGEPEGPSAESPRVKFPRPVGLAPLRQPTAITTITDRDGEAPRLEADASPPRRDRNAIQTSSIGVGLTISPVRAASAEANGAWSTSSRRSRCWPITWPAGPQRIGLATRGWSTTRGPSGGASSPWRTASTRSARRLTLHLPQGWFLWETQFIAPWLRLRALPLLPDGTDGA